MALFGKQDFSLYLDSFLIQGDLSDFYSTLCLNMTVDGLSGNSENDKRETLFIKHFFFLFVDGNCIRISLHFVVEKTIEFFIFLPCFSFNHPASFDTNVIHLLSNVLCSRYYCSNKNIIPKVLNNF